MSISVSAVTAITQALEQADRAAEEVRRATAPAREPAGDQVDLSTAAVKLLAARTAFSVGIELAKTADEIDREAINLLA